MNRDIAIIGMAGRFPGADNLQQLFINLRDEVDSVGPISPERVEKTTLHPGKDYLVCGYLENIDAFDHALFQLSLGEAETMDPHQRLLLEVVHETIENAAYNVDVLKNSNTAVFVADAELEYYKHADEFIPTLAPGNTKAFLATRISRHFNLAGSAMVVDTTCSSSLAIIHLACNELLLGEADYAIACGAHLVLFPYKQTLKGLDLNSPDGKSRAFSSRAQGMSVGECVAGVLLKRLDKALADGDIIHAIIKGTSVNSNAAKAASITAPDSTAQAEVINKAWKKANVDPRTIGYIEVHGSGTVLGDGIEIGGLDQAFRSFTDQKQICPISTIKSNIGHTRSAAGIAGFLKTVLSLKHQVLFPNIHFEEPHPLINFTDSSVYVNQHFRQWPSAVGIPRRAGVSSIGLSGTNCHAVLEEFVDSRRNTKEKESQGRFFLVPVSARTPQGLKRNLTALYEHLEKNRLELADVSHTLSRGRKHLPARFACLAQNTDQLKQALRDALSAPDSETESEATPRLIFILSDETAVPEEVIRFFRARFSGFEANYRSCQILADHYAHSHPEIPAFQYCLFNLLKEWGISTDSLLGVGMGKIVSAAVAGKLTLEGLFRQTRDYQKTPLTELNQRIETLIQREATSGAVVFVSLGLDSELTLALRERSGREKNVEVLSLDSGVETDPLLTLLESFYRKGLMINWDTYGKYYGGRKIELPTYCFEKTRCWIRSVPRMQTGEVDFSADSKPVSCLLEKDGSEVEHTLAAIWSETLGKPVISLTDHFFTLGGNSLTASKTIIKINQAFDLSLAFEDIFDYATLRELAAFITAQWSTERKVLSYWKNVFKGKMPGLDDNFFEMGGHSLLANQLLNRIQDGFGITLSFEDIYKYSSIRTLARHMDGLLGQKVPARATSRLPLVEEQDYYGASHVQRRLWGLSQVEEASLAYNNFDFYTLKGTINSAALEAAFAGLIMKHEILRTVFVEIDGVPKQKVLSEKAVAFRLTIMDLRGTGGMQKCRQLMEEEARTPFALHRAPLFRVQLLQIEEEQFVLLLNIHHIISDGWSMQIIFNELALFYNARLSGVPSGSQPMYLQYKDFTGWQNKQINSSDFASHREYWHGKLGGELSPLSLPADRNRPKVKTFRGEKIYFTLESALTRQLNQVGNKQGASLFVTFMAALKVLLYRYTNQTDLIVGTPVSGREHLDLENQIGCYINTLAVRTLLQPEDSFNEVIGKVRASLMGAFTHQSYPFDYLVDELHLRRNSSHSPLFDVLLVQNPEVNLSQPLEGITVVDDVLSNEHGMSKFDLTFDVSDWKDGLRVGVEFSRDLFERTTIERLTGHLVRLMAALADQPEHAVGRVNYLSPTEELALTCTVNNTDTDYTRTYSVPALFELQVTKSPDSVALVIEDQTFTYRGLNEQANQLARRIEQLYPINRGDVIGLILERSEWMVISMMSVMKLGAAYLPLDPGYPGDRLNRMVQDAFPKLLLVENEEIAGKFLLAGYHPVLRKDLMGEPVTYSGENLERRVEATDLAYVMYTSGSTGVPNGVAIEHQGIVRLVNETNYIRITSSANVLHTSSFSFDVTTFEVWGPLLNGAALHILTFQELMDPEALGQKVWKDNIDIAWFTSAWFNQLVDSNPEIFTHLKYLLVGGEKLSPPHVNRVRRYNPQLTFINGYGPTENTTFSICHRVDAVYETSVPLGKPISNSTVLILDENAMLVPEGVWGEIYLGGDGLARGYLNKPELTAQKFIQLSFPGIKTTRWYRSGDIGKWLEGGLVGFLGRKDRQVKVRGYRIELAEIESCLMKLNSIQQAIVQVKSWEGVENAIVAYFMAGNEVPIRELKASLEGLLPAFMIPTFFVQLPEFPITANGKINLAMLMPPDLSRSKREAVRVGNWIERKIMTVWKDVLAIPEPDADENFFDLGGHSLKAIQALARLNKMLEVKITLKAFFEHPTLSGLATYILSGLNVADQKITPIESQEYYRASHAQQRLWIQDYFDGGNSANNIFSAYLLEGDLDLEAFEKSIGTIVKRHESLRTSFIQIHGRLMQKLHDFETVKTAFCYEDLPDENEHLVVLQTILKQEAERVFDLGKEPLFSAKLVRMAPEKYVFTLSLHHIIGDWSSNLLIFNEFINLYKAYQQGEPNLLTAPEMQYKDYSSWHNRQLEGGKLAEQRHYWLKVLEKPFSPYSVPGDLSSGNVKNYEGRSIFIELDGELTAGLKKMNHECGSTLYTTFLTSVFAFLYRFSEDKSDDIILGMLLSGRDQYEWENIVGFFVNSMPVRASLGPGLLFRQLLVQVRNQVLGALEHQLYPYNKLVDEISTGGLPLINILVASLIDENEIDAGVIPGLTLKELDYLGDSRHDFEITFAIAQLEEKIGILIRYNKTRYRIETMQLIGEGLVQLMRAAVSNPSVTLQQLPYLSEAEQSTQYWRGVLAGISRKPFIFPGRKSVSNQPQLKIGQWNWAFSCDQTEKVLALAEKHHFSLSSFLAVLWGTLLSQYNFHQDITLGVQEVNSAGSNAGPYFPAFKNIVPVKMRIIPGQTLDRVVTEVGKQWDESQFHRPDSMLQFKDWFRTEEKVLDFILLFHPGGFPDEEMPDYQSYFHFLFDQFHTNILLVVTVTGWTIGVECYFNQAEWAEEGFQTVGTHLDTLLTYFISSYQEGILSEMNVLTMADIEMLFENFQ